MNALDRLPVAWPPETCLFLAGSALALMVAPVASEWVTPTGWIAALAIAVAVAGIPHGALDPWIAYRAGVWRRLPGFLVFNLAYLLLACALALLWWALPGITLALFLAYAAWHFASDWHDALGGGWRLLAGTGLITLPAVFHEASVAEIFGVLAGSGGRSIAETMAWAGPAVVAGHALAMVAALRHAPRVALELATIALLASALPPLAFFAVYFCLLHSARHLRGHLTEGTTRERPVAVIIAISYTGLTIALAAAAWYVLGAGVAIEAALLKLVFIGLAALTVPHMVLALYADARHAHSR